MTEPLETTAHSSLSTCVHEGECYVRLDDLIGFLDQQKQYHFDVLADELRFAGLFWKTQVELSDLETDA